MPEQALQKWCRNEKPSVALDDLIGEAPHIHPYTRLHGSVSCCPTSMPASSASTSPNFNHHPTAATTIHSTELEQ